MRYAVDPMTGFAFDLVWNEGEHPRAKDGKFTDKDAANEAPKASESVVLEPVVPGDKSAAKSIAYQQATCGRCGGTGRFGPTVVWGGRCFQCGGSGKVITKRGAAAKATVKAQLESYRKPVEAFKVGDEVHADGKYRKILSIATERDGRIRLEVRPYQIAQAGDMPVMGDAVYARPGDLLRRRPTDEEWAAAVRLAQRTEGTIIDGVPTRAAPEVEARRERNRERAQRAAETRRTRQAAEREATAKAAREAFAGLAHEEQPSGSGKAKVSMSPEGRAEIGFNRMPSDETRATLRGAGYRWDPASQKWWKAYKDPEKAADEWKRIRALHDESGMMRYVTDPITGFAFALEWDEAEHPRDDSGKFTDKGGAARATYPDGRLKPIEGDKVYQVVPGFGGTGAHIYGEVYAAARSGKLRVRVTGSAAMIGAAQKGKTYPLNDYWTVKDDPAIARRRAAREERQRLEAERRVAEQERFDREATEKTAKAIAAGHTQLTKDNMEVGRRVATHWDQRGAPLYIVDTHPEFGPILGPDPKNPRDGFTVGNAEPDGSYRWITLYPKGS